MRLYGDTVTRCILPDALPLQRLLTLHAAVANAATGA